MNRILLADDSPHAQRMGERILRDEGYEVVSVTDGETALLRMADVDPDLVLADVFLPGRSGLDICSYVKTEPAHSHVRLVLTAGMLEPFDEDQARAAGADAIIKKPFEASAVIETIKPLIAAAQAAKGASPKSPLEEAPPAPPIVAEPHMVESPARPARAVVEMKPTSVVRPAIPEPPPHRPIMESAPPPEPPARPSRPVLEMKPAPEPKRFAEAPPLDVDESLTPPGAGVSEEELLRAAVALALDAAFPALVEDITAKVLRNLRAVTEDAGASEDESSYPSAPFLNDLN